MKPIVRTIVAIATVSAAFACSKKDVSSLHPSPQAQAKAQEIFKTRCTVCHGEDGRGTGPGAAALDPKPRNYHDAPWQAQVTNDDLRKIIVKGGAAVGKSALMPPNPDLEKENDVVDGLVKIVRDFAAP